MFLIFAPSMTLAANESVCIGSQVCSVFSLSSLHSLTGLIPRPEQNTELANYFKNIPENAGEI